MTRRSFSNSCSPGWVLLAAGMILLSGACKKNNGSGPNKQTLQQYFSVASRYTLFNRALQRTHLDTLVGGTNPYTVFAVNDSAMGMAGYSAAGIDSADIATLTGILRYHLVPGSIASTDVQLYRETILKTADSSYLAYLAFNDFGLFYDGIPLLSIDNRLVNGIVQEIQTMARPPVGDLVTTIAKTPGLSDFSYVITLAANTVNYNAGVSAVIPYISGTTADPITLFLPDDHVYTSLGLNNNSTLAQQGSNVAAYWTQGQYFTSDFVGENIVPNIMSQETNGNQLWFSADGTTFVEASLNAFATTLSNRYRIVQPNIVATNGIIHVFEPY